MGVKIQWPELTFPPINLWNAPRVRRPRPSAVSTVRARRAHHRGRSPAMVIEALTHLR